MCILYINFIYIHIYIYIYIVYSIRKDNLVSDVLQWNPSH